MPGVLPRALSVPFSRVLPFPDSLSFFHTGSAPGYLPLERTFSTVAVFGPGVWRAVLGTLSAPRLSGRPCWNNKGSVSSVSLPRGRLGKDQSRAGARTLKESRLWLLGTQLFPTEGLRASVLSQLCLRYPLVSFPTVF